MATVTFPEQIARWTATAEDSRIVACFECGKRVELRREVISLVCPFCNALIETAPVEVSGIHTRGIRTRGRVLIQNRGRYDGPPLIAGRLEVHGIITPAYTCDELVLGRLAKLQTAGQQRAIQVLAGGRVEIGFPIEAVEARIGGVLEVPLLDVAGTLYLPRGGAVIAQRVRVGGLVVEKGARLECELDASPRPHPGQPKPDPLPSAAAPATAAP